MNYDDWKATNPADEELGEPPCKRCFADGFSECRCEPEEEPTAGNVLLTPDGQQTSLPGPPVGCPHCGHVHLGYSGCGMRLRGDAPAWCKCGGHTEPVAAPVAVERTSDGLLLKDGLTPEGHHPNSLRGCWERCEAEVKRLRAESATLTARVAELELQRAAERVRSLLLGAAHKVIVEKLRAELAAVSKRAAIAALDVGKERYEDPKEMSYAACVHDVFSEKSYRERRARAWKAVAKRLWNPTWQKALVERFNALHAKLETVAAAQSLAGEQLAEALEAIRRPEIPVHPDDPAVTAALAAWRAIHPKEGA